MQINGAKHKVTSSEPMRLCHRTSSTRNWGANQGTRTVAMRKPPKLNSKTKSATEFPIFSIIIFLRTIFPDNHIHLDIKNLCGCFSAAVRTFLSQFLPLCASTKRLQGNPAPEMEHGINT